MVETIASPKVIVVDDQRLIADTLAEILNRNGYDAAAVYSGEEALDQINRSNPDIVLSDVRMHKLDGIQTAMRIRILHPTCRLILFSASGISDDEQARIDECEFEFLGRPLHPKEILNLLGGRTPTNLIPFRTAHMTRKLEETDLPKKDALGNGPRGKIRRFRQV